MNTRAEFKDAEIASSHDRSADAHRVPVHPDEEEQAYLREMMKESRRTTRREIERLYGPIEMSE